MSFLGVGGKNGDEYSFVCGVFDAKLIHCFTALFILDVAVNPPSSTSVASKS